MTNFSGVSGSHLNQVIEKIEYLEEQKAGVANDIREIYAEAKSHGFDVKIIRKIIGIRKMDQQELAEHEELLTLYMNAINAALVSGAQTKKQAGIDDSDDDN